MPKPDIKSRPQRIELDYFQRPDPLARRRRRLVYVAVMLAGGYGLYATIWGAAAHVNTGPLSTAHAHLEQDCAACHSHPWQVSLASDAWRIAPEKSLQLMELTCQRCHAAAPHFRSLLNQDHVAIDQNCTGCHREHLGRDYQLTQVTDRECITCHGDLARCMVSPTSSLRSRIQEFNLESHGEFRSLANDPGHVHFDHWQHLQPGQVPPQTKGATRLDVLSARWRAAYQKPGQASESAVMLNCQDCHQLPSQMDARIVNADWEITSDHYLPIRYAEHCVGCHPLNYDAFQSHEFLPLPHAAPWLELESILAAKLAGGRWLAANKQDRTGDISLGPRPAQTVEDSDEAEQAGLSRALQMVQQQCLKCHLADDITDQAIERLRSGHGRDLIPTRWFQHASFDHVPHRQMDCQFCHHAADRAQSSQPDHETVMIDGIASCTLCHRAANSAPPAQLQSQAKLLEGQATWAADRCTLCHRYHWTRPPETSPSARAEDEGKR